MEAAKTLWASTLGARLALDRTFPERATRILFFRLRDITIEISGGARQTEEGIGKPDRFWGLAWGVDDLDAACARLRGAGVEVSEPRTGIKPGTRVATVKGEHTHGVATLLIEHSAQSFEPASRLPQGAAYDNTPQQRAFTLTALDHVTISARDIDETKRVWESTLSMTAGDEITSKIEPLRLAKLPAGNAFIELAQPASPEHRMARAIEERGTGMYAIAVEVDNIDAAVADLRAKGVLVSDPEYGAWPGTRVARVNKNAAHGVQIQLVQRLPDVL
jgi:methylmalonyl-CoA/ethylmalonyl-CoA epimerase